MKRIINTVFLLLIAITINAQSSFERSILVEGVFPSTHFTNFVKMVDLDGDGDNDVVGAARDRALVWYENIDGQGYFSSRKMIADNLSGIISLDVGDLNGDGLLDILIVSNSSDLIGWYANLGDGVISTELNYIYSSFNTVGVSTATIVDLDSDGDNDVVFGVSAASNFIKPLYWSENTDGTGSFSNPIRISDHLQQADSYPLGIGDFDGNGAIDIVVSGIGMSIYFNDGNQNFEKVYLDGLGSGTNRMTVLDYDGDGDPDLVTGYESIAWYRNDGGTFSSPIMLHPRETTDLQPGDFDGDGDLDLAAGFIEETPFFWLENQGPNNPVVVHQSANDLYFQQRLSVGDIDGDGDLDVIGSDARGSIITLTNTDQQGTFERTDDVNSQLSWAEDIRSADIDGDGDLDLLIADQGSDRVDWYENVNGDGSRMQQHNIIYDYANARTAVDADVDGDGDLDVITYGASDLRLLWFENMDGLGNFGNGNLIADNMGSDQYLNAADFDGNGTIDIILNFRNGRDVTLFRNLGGFFAEGEIVIESQFSTTIIVDLDQDGDPDIVGARENSIRWGENLFGTGEFTGTRNITYDGNGSWWAVHASDVDGDSDLDLVYFADGVVGWIEHLDGIGGFEDPVEIIELPNVSSLHRFSEVKDLDNDGDEDILFLGYSGMVWYENLGYKSNRWSSAKEIVEEESLAISHIADFTGDGVNDIVNFKLGGEILSLYKNTQPPQNFISGYVNRGALDSCSTTTNPVEGLLVSSIDGANIYASYTNGNGQFLNKVPLGNYTTTVTNLPTGFTIDPVEQQSEITEQSRKDTLTYCVDSNTMDSIQNNLSVHLFRLTQEARPGFDVFYRLVYRNLGTTTLSDTIMLTFDNELMDYLIANVAPELITDGTLTWVFDDLGPFESRKINLKFNIKPPPIVDDLDIIRFKATIGPITDDIQPENNCYNYRHYLVNSYDPNDITVFEGPEVRYEDYLRNDTMNYLNYMIRFQNTGTASAVNIRLANVIDQNLDWTTLDIISSSHPYRAEITNKDSLSIYYDGIYLPDSTTDLAGSQGFITYQIKMKKGLDVGTTILNDAEIYFDFNEPIYTNQVSTQLIQITATNALLTAPTATIYPNPTTGWTNIVHSERIASYEIYDLRGALLNTETGSNKINMHPYEPGMYLLKLVDGLGRLYSLKLLKL